MAKAQAIKNGVVLDLIEFDSAEGQEIVKESGCVKMPILKDDNGEFHCGTEAVDFIKSF
jgi:hypothetical protein